MANLDETSDFSLFQSLLQDESPPSVQYNMPNPLLMNIYRDNSNSSMDMPPLVPLTPPQTPP